MSDKINVIYNSTDYIVCPTCNCPTIKKPNLSGGEIALCDASGSDKARRVTDSPSAHLSLDEIVKLCRLRISGQLLHITPEILDAEILRACEEWGTNVAESWAKLNNDLRRQLDEADATKKAQHTIVVNLRRDLEAIEERLQQAEADKVALGFWLKGSLECKSHIWEPDQRAVAQLLIDDLEKHKIKAEDTPA